MRSEDTVAPAISHVGVLGSKGSEARSRWAHSWPHGLRTSSQRMRTQDMKDIPKRKGWAENRNRKWWEPRLTGTKECISTLRAKIDHETPLLNIWTWLGLLVGMRLVPHGSPKWRQRSRATYPPPHQSSLSLYEAGKQTIFAFYYGM